MAKTNGNSETPDRTGKVLITLSREARETKGQELAHERELFKALRKKKRTHVGEWNEQLKQLEETIDRLAEEVESGEAWVDAQYQLELEKKVTADNKAKANGKKAAPKPAKKSKAKRGEARA